MSRLFLLAYTCSGFAGLVYQVCWTRLLTLYIGHGTAAASVVVTAFLGGLAVGAAGGGAVAPRLTKRQSLVAYAALEIVVAAAALLFPLELRAFGPALSATYNNGEPSVLFPAIRLLACLLMVFAPAVALGATFPMAVRWFSTDATNRATSSGALYALNTTGAAVGALFAGFVLLPRLGISGTTLVGVAASVVAAASVLLMLVARETPQPVVIGPKRARRARGMALAAPPPRTTDSRWLGAFVLGVSGFCGLVHEIVWTRILTLTLGPTTYAFAATLAAVIGGVAIGSAFGTWVGTRTRQPAFWLAMALAVGAVTTVVTCALAGGPIPGLVAQRMVDAPGMFNELLWQGGLLTTALILPAAACLGAAFPLAIATADDPTRSAASQFGGIYAVNTVGAVVGSLAAGFFLISTYGLETTLKIVSGCLLAAALVVVAVAVRTTKARVTAAATIAAGVVLIAASPGWDRALLSSGAYIYAPFAPAGVDVEAVLRAGTLLYYREGAAATVSVKRLTGTTTLAVDGKTDASNRSDMLTQKLVAHLPLLLHNHPSDVAIIGLGSGVTVGAALTHPIGRVDVIEISPEVIEASDHFAAENRRALSDARTNVVVGDGRSHLLLSQRRYDVIISEPSNPWIAGVASLFTREFFLAARQRLAPGGVICQWANAYNISDRDLRSIIATFQSVFPHGTAWLVGADDVVLVASDAPLDSRLGSIASHWQRPGVADDLRVVGALEPFSLLSLFVAGPQELQRYGAGAALLDDDRMMLEFSAPRQLHGRSAGQNGAILSALLRPEDAPSPIREALRTAAAAEWRNRGAMMTKRDAHSSAYDDYVKALTRDPADGVALEAFVRTAIITKRGADALSWLNALTAGHRASVAMLVARSKLLASIDARAEAVQSARDAAQLEPTRAVAFEQLASLHADIGDHTQLDAAVMQLQRVAPEGAATHYYAAVARFLHGDAVGAVDRAQAAIRVDPTYAAVYDLMGAAHTKLGDASSARDAFMTSLRYDAHDSAAYANLGLLELTVGNRAAAANYFAEALWLDAESSLAREGLVRSTAAR